MNLLANYFLLLVTLLLTRQLIEELLKFLARWDYLQLSQKKLLPFLNYKVVICIIILS